MQTQKPSINIMSLSVGVVDPNLTMGKGVWPVWWVTDSSDTNWMYMTCPFHTTYSILSVSTLHQRCGMELRQANWWMAYYDCQVVSQLTRPDICGEQSRYVHHFSLPPLLGGVGVFSRVLSWIDGCLQASTISSQLGYHFSTFYCSNWCLVYHTGWSMK